MSAESLRPLDQCRQAVFGCSVRVGRPLGCSISHSPYIPTCLDVLQRAAGCCRDLLSLAAAIGMAYATTLPPDDDDTLVPCISYLMANIPYLKKIYIKIIRKKVYFEMAT